MNNTEILEEFIKYFEAEATQRKYRRNISITFGEDDIEAIENLIQENKELKDKIKEKIEEIEKRKQDLLQLPDDCARTLGLEDCDEKIILYKELLEEGE